MTDSFSHILGNQRGRGANIGSNLRGERLSRLSEAARQGNLDAAHGIWRRDQHISTSERDQLFDSIVEGALSSVSEELDLEIHWRRVFTSTGLWKDSTELIKFGPGNLLHICPEGKEAVCGASQNIHNAPRGSWAEPAYNASRCLQCCQEAYLDDDIKERLDERRALIPFESRESEQFRQQLIEGVDFQGDYLYGELKRQMLSLLQEKLAITLNQDSEKTMKIIQRQMLRTSSFELRKRLWQVYGIKEIDEIDLDGWRQVSQFVLSTSGLHQIVWAGLCHTLSNKEPERPIWQEMKRIAITPLVIRPSRAEKEESRRIGREIKERRRAGW